MTKAIRIKKRLNSDRQLAFLVASARLSDQAAMQELARRCHGRFLAHSWRLTGDKEVAQDVAQEAWVEIIRGLNNLRDDHRFLPWGYRIVSRRAAKWIKRKQRRRLIAGELKVEQGVLVQLPAADDENLALRQAMATLPAEQHAAIALFYREGMSLAEISVALDVPVGTVKSRLSTARGTLRAIFEKE